MRPIAQMLVDNRLTRPIRRAAVRAQVRLSLARLNAAHNRMTLAQRGRFHERYSRMFERIGGTAQTWHVKLPTSTLRLPLDPQQIGLHWDAAISVLGHDVGVKEAYLNLLASAERPDMFVDIGTNYGTHSLIFLSEGVETLSFEPNAVCHSYFLETAAMNGFAPRLEAVALGAERGTLELTCPEGEPWLGSADPAVVAGFSSGVTRLTAPVRPLDDYLPQMRGRVLIKIDVEGFEEQVIAGAGRVLREARPTVIFESNDAAHLARVVEALRGHGYAVRSLGGGTNFMAVHHSTFLTDRLSTENDAGG